jgi:hypothetical protein
MLFALTSVLISLAILAIVYIVLRWILSYLSLPAPVDIILRIIVGVVAIVLIIRFVATLL